MMTDTLLIDYLYQKRSEALELAFKSKELEPNIDLVQEAQNIYEWLNLEETVGSTKG
jgi:hypothetical protein